MTRRFVVEIADGTGDRSESYITEIPTDMTDFATIVRDIAGGQYEKIVRVWELKRLNENGEPITREIARAVGDHLFAEGRVPWRDLRRFLTIQGVETLSERDE